MGNLKQRFGHLVVAHRRRFGWTQHKLADAADLSDDMVARIEKGRTGVSFSTVEKLAGALKIDPAELFTNELPFGALQRSAATELTARLGGLKPDEITWLAAIIDAALTPRRPQREENDWPRPTE